MSALRYRLLVAVLVMAVLIPSVGICQTALNAEPGDSIYNTVDLLIAHGLVNDVIIGQRPYSRLEIARILRTARQSLDARSVAPDDKGWDEYAQSLSEKNFLDRLLANYEREYAQELKGARHGVTLDALGQLDMQMIYNSSKPRRIPISNGQGSIDGIISSFDRYVPGFTYDDGTNTIIESHHAIYLTPYFAASIEPRLRLLDPSGTEEHPLVDLHRLYATAGWRNIQVEVGRDNVMWGQSEFGGLMLSSNARPLDLLKISNPYPWKAPWIFKYLGYMKLTFFASNLGPEREFPYSYFYGMKWTLRPHRCVEFGLSETVIMGGSGAPKVGFWEPLTELFPFHKWGGANIGAADISNHAFGFLDFRITIPPLRNSILYYDGYIEDSIVRAFRLPDNLMNQLSFIAGWYSPRLTRNGDVALRLEYHHVAPLSYRHSTWATGYTLNQRPMGDPLGPDADGIYATIYWMLNPKYRLRFDVAYEDYDSSTYYTQMNADGGGDRILKFTSGPHERRGRLVTEIEWRPRKRYGLAFSAGYERIQNWNFEVGRSVNNMLLGARLTLYFDEFVARSHASRAAAGL